MEIIMIENWTPEASYKMGFIPSTPYIEQDFAHDGYVDFYRNGIWYHCVLTKQRSFIAVPY